MTLEIVQDVIDEQKPRRQATVKQRLSKTKLTYSMLEGSHKLREANREFFLQRLWDDVLNILECPEEAHALVDEAYEHQQNKEERENRAQLKAILAKPGMAEAANGLIPAESTSATAKKATSTDKK
mgnify:CR=1 FL=1